MDNIFCIECGFELPSTAKFCKKCGVEIEASESHSESDTETNEDKPFVTHPTTEASSSKANKTKNIILEWVITFAVAIIVMFIGVILFGAKNASWIGVIGWLITRASIVSILRSIFPHRYEYENNKDDEDEEVKFEEDNNDDDEIEEEINKEDNERENSTLYAIVFIGVFVGLVIIMAIATNT